ncbi:MAG: hypothetical protein K8H88_15405 [Sandaracinaceae bacterium]|nr:hypothetical protein [Sandaracinaceae bacterium]
MALRHLQEAVRELVAFQGAFVLAISELTPDERRQWELLTAKLADQASPEMLVEDEGRRLLRWTLDVIVALVVMEGDIDDLAFWARRALEGARFARALRDAHGPLDLRGELAKARAQLAWTDWDDEDVATELAPWPQDA